MVKEYTLDPVCKWEMGSQEFCKLAFLFCEVPSVGEERLGSAA